MKHVLIVDDEEKFRVSMHALLRNHFHVLMAQDGKEAVHALSNEQIDLCLLDYRLPDIDGDSLLEIIRQYHSHIPVILLTGYPSRELEKKITRPPYNAGYFLPKPPDPFFLQEIINELIEKHQHKRLIDGETSSTPERRERSNERKKRLLDIIDLLKQKPFTLGELKIKFNRSISQLHRDIFELIEIGLPIRSSPKGYYWDHNEPK